MAEENAGNISVKSGNCIAITTAGSKLGALCEKDLVEVADYNSETNMAMVMGLKEPSSETPMHWLVHNERPDIGAIVHVHDLAVLPYCDKFCSTKDAHPYGTLDLAHDVLSALSHDDYIVIREHGVVAIGKTVSEAERRIFAAHEKVATFK